MTALFQSRLHQSAYHTDFTVNQSSLLTFRQQLKTFLFEQSYS